MKTWHQKLTICKTNMNNLIKIKYLYIHVFRKSLTEMDTVIGCSTDLLPEKSIINDPKEIINSIKIRLKNTNL